MRPNRTRLKKKRAYWLSGQDSSRTREKKNPRLLRYQLETMSSTLISLHGNFSLASTWIRIFKNFQFFQILKKLITADRLPPTKKKIRYYFISLQVCCLQRPRRARAQQRSRGHVPYLRLVCTSLMHLLPLGSAPPPSKKRPICLVTKREKSEKYNLWAGNDIQPSSSTNM